MQKLLICGDGRSGKDLFANIVEKHTQVKATSSSWAARHFVWRNYFNGENGPYPTAEKCWDDRANHRSVWKTAIEELNERDPTTLAAKIFSLGDIYVGCRAKREFHAIMGRWECLPVYISREGIPPDPTNEITSGMCSIGFTNDGTIEEFSDKIVSTFIPYWLSK